jgi:hypothetical protein
MSDRTRWSSTARKVLESLGIPSPQAVSPVEQPDETFAPADGLTADPLQTLQLPEKETSFPDPNTAPLGKCWSCGFMAPLTDDGRCGGCISRSA